MTLSQADIDSAPEEQSHYLKQQNVTTISIEAELCRSIESHGDSQVPGLRGSFVLVLLVPEQRKAPCVLVQSWQTGTPSG